MERNGLESAQRSFWGERRSLGHDLTWCHGDRGRRRPGRPRARREHECGLGHRTAAGRRCGALTALAAMRSERAQWPSPGRQR